MVRIKEVLRLPKAPGHDTLYRLSGRQGKIGKKYFERTDRNDGCLVRDIEQPILHRASVAIIGLGGMGGYQAETFVRLGIGDIWIADIGTFDVSNTNRQWGATKLTVNRDKALGTAALMRNIADDFTLTVCPSGLNERTADALIRGRDVVIDMIEFWSLADRIWLHRTCQKHGVVAINCNSIVHASFGMRFDYRRSPSKKALGGYMTLIERQLSMTYEHARELQTKYEDGVATVAEKSELMEAVFSVFIPEEIEYMRDLKHSTRHAFRRRLVQEGRVPVVSVNPPFAAGWCATEAYFEILSRHSPLKRTIERVATFPSVTRIDLGKKSVTVIKLPIRSRLKPNYS